MKKKFDPKVFDNVEDFEKEVDKNMKRFKKVKLFHNFTNVVKKDKLYLQQKSNRGTGKILVQLFLHRSF